MLVHADEVNPADEPLFKAYNPPGTPTVMVVAADGNVIDWHVGYMPPSYAFVMKLEKSAKGIDTFKGLSDRFAAHPTDAEAAFKLAMKYSEAARLKEAVEKWTAVVALDPDGRTGTTVEPEGRCTVSYTEYAEYSLALAAAHPLGGKADPAPLLAFLKKYPKSTLQTRANLKIASLLPSADDTLRWFDQIANRYPGDVGALEAYLAYLTRTGANPERAQQIGERLLALQQARTPIDSFYQTVADIHYAQGDADRAVSSYGPEVVKLRTRMMALDLARYASYWAGRKTNTESAIWAADTAMRLFEEDPAAPDSVVTLSAGAYLKLGLGDKAAAVLGPAYARQHWNDTVRLFSYTQFWTRQGLHLGEAIAAAQRLTALAPDNFRAWEMLSAAYSAQRDHAAALASAQKALAVAGESDKDRLRDMVARLKADATRKDK